MLLLSGCLWIPEEDACPAWHADADGDGFGDPAAVLRSCEQPRAYVADERDCNDDDAHVHPDAGESCGGGDEDCDGESDEDDAADAIQWYEDADGDGHGGSVSVSACERPPGYFAASDDCDDTNRDLAPSSEEVCGDGVDQDCSSVPDDNCGPLGQLTTDDAALVLVGEAELNSFGSVVSGGGDIDGDGFGDFIVTAPLYGASPDVGAMYVFRGPLDAGMTRDDAHAVVTGDANYQVGYAATMVDDFTRDGFADLAVSAVLGSDAGAKVYFGPSPVGETAYYNLQFPIASGTDPTKITNAGDVDGDGLGDVAFLTGATGVWSSDVWFADATIYQAALFHLIEETVDIAAGQDLTGDGLPDVVLGDVNLQRAWICDAQARGAIIAGEGHCSSSVTWDTPDNVGFGTSVALIADADGDGLGEILVGASTDADGGLMGTGAFLFPSPIVGTVAASDAAAAVRGDVEGERIGERVAGVGDIDGDGFGDLAVADFRSHARNENNGVVLLEYSPFAGSTSASDSAAVISGGTGWDNFGYSVAGLGTIGPEGEAVVAVGAYGYVGHTGAVGFFYGK